MHLDNKIIYLTGGTKGIGLECARAYAAQGATVVTVSNDAASNTEDVLFADVSKEEDVRRTIQYTLDKYGRIDAVHNNAGIAHPAKPLHETTGQQWDDLFSINVKSILYTTKYAFAALRESKGCILNTSSLVGEIGQENHAAYSGTKGAMNALTKSMALDYAPFHIRVNAVAPAGVWTPMLREWNAAQENAQDMERYLNEIHPLGYCPEGDVIADVCVFLLSEKARFVTGLIMPVSGGAELGYRRI
ncbi:SDR family NAD(P)-dependent oxidoreductase [Puia dinghuensis]|uniref:Short-chain dehydrogenase n=1 Tax=Puia dinghuensis TaxID=1792502 RepID=A0A8J2UG07_9BACT|nr:SDR family oxidoreductase [Puia dinghuensis]GGB12673.1 short-chain dehydrogenase [Puia dinghuensis]